MKIGVLNLPFDNNYGGSLQRYALMIVLERMGHEPIHLNCRYVSEGRGSKTVDKLRKTIQKFFLMLDEAGINSGLNYKYGSSLSQVDRFYGKYIRHTPVISCDDDMKSYAHYDCYMVGSDQVWRRRYIIEKIGKYYFDFLSEDTLRIAYAVSFGDEEDDYTERECEKLYPLYKKFKAVSVRENTGLSILNARGWNSPKAVQTLDPTLLLSPKDYWDIILQNKTTEPKGKLLVYVLDERGLAEIIIKKNGLNARYQRSEVAIDSRRPVSVPQWLRNFAEAECVITDSYHGLIFSIIFNKPFYVIINEKRGASRFHSLLDLFSLEANGLNLKKSDWNIVNKRIESHKAYSLRFLINSLS